MNGSGTGQTGSVAAISAEVSHDDLGSWYRGAFDELYASLSAQDVEPDGDAGGVYAAGLFSHEFGAATVYRPTSASFRPAGSSRSSPRRSSWRSSSTAARTTTSTPPTAR